MRPHYWHLYERGRAEYDVVHAFLKNRLEERSTIDWALQLKPNDTAKRTAVLDLIDNPIGLKIREPWRSAWRLIEESWNNPPVEDNASTGAYHAQNRLRAGDRSGSLITAIVELVAPQLKVESFEDLHLHFRKLPKRPKKVIDLFSTGLTSGEIVDPDMLGLGGLTDRPFLMSLALALDSAVANGLDIARRIGWGGEHYPWQLGQLHRVYYVPTAERAQGEHEPDEFHRGIAPSVKLLHVVVSRLVDMDISGAVEFARRWKLSNSPIHLRLWCALSRNPLVTPANEASDLLLSLDDERFWNLHDFPEISELRAMRFSEFDFQEQVAVTARIRKSPPRNQWPRKADANMIKSARLYRSIRELRRIEIAGGSLPLRDKIWLDTRIHKFKELTQMTRLHEGFPNYPKAELVPPNPDSQYNLLSGEERLRALEASLSSTRGVWDDDPGNRATDWIRQQGNSVKVLNDFDSISDGGAAFPKVWERFSWAHSPGKVQGEDSVQRDLQSECSLVLSLLAKLSKISLLYAINGISHWLSSWEKQVVLMSESLTVWLRIWPLAVEATNAKQAVEEEINLNTVAHSSNNHEPMDLDTLATPAGKLIGVFLAACPNLEEHSCPFDVDGTPRTMREAVIATTGRSRLIARHRMIEELPYFLKADRKWTQDQLISPLNADNSEAIALWRAIARRTHFSEVLKIIGEQMAERATDKSLGRETQSSLVFSLIIECLHAFHEKRSPAVPYPRIQQMIRTLDDEVRAYGAGAVQRFVRDVSEQHEGSQGSPSAEKLFRSAGLPFLTKVWPQERSLATPGVTRALASLPSTAQEAFAEAVNAIERFLVPFECWSLLDYGLYGDKDGRPKLSSIDNQEKAAALLRLLDLTIGTAEGSVVPHDLADALDQIRTVVANLAKDRVFLRLATAARRS